MKIKLAIFLLLIVRFAVAQDIAFVRNKVGSSGDPCSNELRDSLHLSSENYNANTVHIGLEAGLNISNIVYPHSSYFKGSLSGLNAGITFDVPVEFSFSFDAAILFSQKGYFSETAYGGYTQRLNFIDVPVLYKAASTHGKFNFFIGPQLSFLLSAKTAFDNGFNGNQSNYNYSAGKIFIDGFIGESFDIFKNLDICVGYTIDLNKTNSMSLTIPDYHNQAFQIGFGVKFN